MIPPMIPPPPNATDEERRRLHELHRAELLYMLQASSRRLTVLVVAIALGVVAASVFLSIALAP